MDPSSVNARPSGIPRPSRLPVPRSVVHASPSRENLQQSRIGGVPNPRLRNAPSREQLTASTSSLRRVSGAPLRSQASSQHLRSRAAATAAPRSVLGVVPANKAGERQTQKDSFSGLTDSQLDVDGQDALDGDHSGLGPLLSGNAGGEPYEREEDAIAQTPRKSRASLSERAVDTLKNIPSSPAIRRRTSSFFNPPESPMRPMSSGNSSSRPGSSHDTSMRPPSRTFNSRPPSRSGQQPVDFRASTSKLIAPKTSLTSSTISKMPSYSNLRTPSATRTRSGHELPTRLPSPGQSQQRARSPSPSGLPKTPVIRSGSATYAPRSLKPRASMNGLFRKPSSTSLRQEAEVNENGFTIKKRPTLTGTPNKTTSNTSAALRSNIATSTTDETQDTTPRKSSLALRDQIAKAKAAKRAAASKPQASDREDVPVVPVDEFDFGLADDPFNQMPKGPSGKGLLMKRIQAARNDGRLNIAALGLKQIPVEVLSMYTMETNDGSWAEAVDLTRFVAAGNEIETIGDEVFPDVDPREVTDDGETNGNQFGGLETLDFHGNLLTALPIGLRRLQLLTTLNMSHNKLDNNALEVISQMASLRDLKMSDNNLSGSLHPGITSLINLETLDLQNNSLSSLPDGLGELSRLRVLNLNSNLLASFPFEAVQAVPITELLLAKNKLIGTLIGPLVESLPHLQVLDVTSNAITALADSDALSLPALHQLNVSSNRLSSLPEMSSWVTLRILNAEDNNIAAIPTGFTSLANLRNVNFNGNNIRLLDDEIGNMEDLDIFRISGNPLRDKKLAGMTVEDLKRTLKARIEPTTQENDTEQDNALLSASLSSPISPRPQSSDWLVLPGGVLDRSNTSSHSLNPIAAAHAAANNHIKVLELHHNTFKEIPSSIGFFGMTLTTLNLSHNELSSDTFMKDELDLPALKELNLSSNTFNSLQPLVQRLQAPNMVRLDISFNRLTSLPALRQHFPSLVTLLASNNTIRELLPDTIKGFTTVDCSSNEINSLNARIGLLGGPGGLQRLDVSGNRFRVPKYTVLEKGTEATLAWLRDRIPAGEGGSSPIEGRGDFV